jgi:hypothetical protein
VVLNVIAFVLAIAFGTWMLGFVVSALRTGRIHHTDSTSTYSFRKQPVRFLFVAALFVAFASIAFYYAAERWNGFWQVDRCLDSGGSWDYELKRCNGARNAL